MNSEPDNLDRLLKHWQPDPMPAARIRAGVWSRIQAAPDRPASDLAALIASWFERPVVAGALVALALGAGAAFGAIASAEAQTRAYLQSLDVLRH